MVSRAAGDEDLLPEAGDLLSWCAAVAAGPAADADACARISDVLDRYLEQAALLDPILPRVVDALVSAVLDPTHVASVQRVPLFVALYTAGKVRGAKHLVRLLPHTPAAVISLIALLSLDSSSRNCAGAGPLAWQVEYVLLLWLSAAMLVPFPLLSIVTQPSIEGLFEHAVRALSSPGKVSDGAAALLAAFLKRKDARIYLNKFMRMCYEQPTTAGAACRGGGTAVALAKIFKTGRREELATYVPPLMCSIDNLVDVTQTGGLVLKVKLSQRMALVYLKERVSAWRYDRGSRSLFGQQQEMHLSTKLTPSPSMSSAADGDNASGDFAQEEVLDVAQEEIVEQAIETLLRGLEHRDTVVRWSSAKGVGRVAARLPREHAEDVVQAVINLFTSPSFTRADSAWHGGCLALAELARRGLILPGTPHFQALFRVVQTASSFDMRRGAHSVGAHVRDAACYVVWALSRAYAKAEVAPHASVITQSMLPIALLDREVNCRRAASAALQESVGRLSQEVIADGINLVTAVDYFSLGDRVASYTKIAPTVASLAGGAYLDCILTELWVGKLVHWDASIRILASRAIAALVPLDAGNVLVGTVLPRLLQVVVERGDALHRHGALLGLSELTLALGARISRDVRDEIRHIPTILDKRGYFRGRVGDCMRVATCRLIECCACTDIGIYSATGPGRVAAERVFAILETTLGSAKEELSSAAVAAYTMLYHKTVAEDISWRAEVCVRVCAGVADDSSVVELQRGFALAAGCLGTDLSNRSVYERLTRALGESPDVEVRRNAAVSIGRLVPVPEPCVVLDLIPVLVQAMRDYTVSDRGDVGSWVREAAMTSFASVVSKSFSASREAGGNSVNVSLDLACLDGICGLVRQSCERINRTRQVAVTSLGILLRCFGCKQALSPLYASILPNCATALEALRLALLGNDGTDNGNGETFAMFTDSNWLYRSARKLLGVNETWNAALTGIVASCGGVAGCDSVSGERARWAEDCILEHLLTLSRGNDFAGVLKVGDALLGILAGDQRDDRLVVPVMTALEYLVCRGAFIAPDGCADGGRFHVRAAAAVRSSWKGRLRDVPRMTAAVNVLCELAMALPSSHCSSPSPPAARKESIEALVVVLGGSVPRLRRLAAESLYVVLVDHPESDAASFRTSLDILADTSWEILSVVEARQTRNALCATLGVDSPKPLPVKVHVG
jgi:tubulin-specific chaperone D